MSKKDLARKGNPKFKLGKNSNGHSAWLRVAPDVPKPTLSTLKTTETMLKMDTSNPVLTDAIAEMIGDEPELDEVDRKVLDKASSWISDDIPAEDIVSVSAQYDGSGPLSELTWDSTSQSVMVYHFVDKPKEVRLSAKKFAKKTAKYMEDGAAEEEAFVYAMLERLGSDSDRYETKFRMKLLPYLEEMEASSQGLVFRFSRDVTSADTTLTFPQMLADLTGTTELPPRADTEDIEKVWAAIPESSLISGNFIARDEGPYPWEDDPEDY